MTRPVLDPVISWYIPPHLLSEKEPRELCPTRDIFQARLDTLYQESIRLGSLSEEETALLVATAGEIGNNCFDHNLGQWQDQTGCWFSWFQVENKEGLFVVIADRGQGILASLKRVQPDLRTEEEALRVAFEQRISGRSPERRGNGLKFVRSVINGHGERGLLFFSGSAKIQWGGNQTLAKALEVDKIENKQGTGTFALIVWGKR